ncbi:gamma-glutamyl-gamma-aminobutyrate hydrolase family protein [Cloacibacillus sp.]|uniref:gamma-glutamyl-gamma-aminobutyrate hydrolase family protein n=1 Tax=Cloacibacillus sp. TaxID=2049023 RepID=UPI0025C55472|nr:gamma-glutamyl-gamma-aminobutyrate hydrolase family protein [Cloacibacillus sp.]MCC8058806.1 gamma-glutamyl-gamma-aminobutyrate hydrolase family protein [Cloacibacillus sp.]
MRPLIGIPTSPFRHAYAEVELAGMDKEALNYFWLLSMLTEKIISCVRAAGGVPLPLTATREPHEIKALVSKLDGFVFAGGSDIAPAFYGEEDKGTIAPDLDRDHFEVGLCREALEKNRPLLGICRGCQLLNVVLGGSLIQNLPDVNKSWTLHRRSDVMKGYVHEVKISAPWLFPNHRGDMMMVNSMHHQAVGRLAKEAEAAARTEDGIIEAIWAPAYKYAIGVQWHPECLAEEDRVQADIFKSLVTKAGE